LKAPKQVQLFCGHYMLDNTVSFQTCYGDILCTACRAPSDAHKIERSGEIVVKVVHSGQDIQLVWNLHVVVLRCGLRVAGCGSKKRPE